MPQSIRMSVCAPYNQRTHVEVNIIWMGARQPTIWKHSKNQFAATVLIEMCAVFGGAMWPSFCLRHVYTWLTSPWPGSFLGAINRYVWVVSEAFVGHIEKKNPLCTFCDSFTIFLTFIEDSVFTLMVSFLAPCFVLFVHWWALLVIPLSLADNSLSVDTQPKTLAKYLTSLPACDLWECEASCA